MAPNPSEGGDLKDRAPRTNLFLAATIEAGALATAVRIRNLSTTGAMLDGPAFPRIGKTLTLRRSELDIGATVMWHTGSRCGIRFDGYVSVAEWVSGKRSGLTPIGHYEQARVDEAQTAIRAGLPIPPTREAPRSAAPDVGLDQRLAEEMAYVKRLLETVGDELTDDPILMQRHSRTLQGFDLACQILGHLGAVMTATDRETAVEAITMGDLKARLLRKPMF
jgi:hypothetical protein